MLAVLPATICAVVRPSLAGESQTDEWKFSATPYVWAISLNGDITIKNRSLSVDASFLDIVEASDSIFAFMGHFDATKGKWGLFFDPAYMNVSAEKGVNLESVNVSVDATMELAIIEFGGTYRIADWAVGPKGKESKNAKDQTAWLDAMVGGRWTYLKGEVDLRVSAAQLGLSGQRVVEKSRSWIDPFVGARLGANLSENWVVPVRGDIGGFGAGSDFTWHVVALAGYSFEMFGRDAAVLAGYRALYQDFERGSGSDRFVWDMTLHGPILGLNVRF